MVLNVILHINLVSVSYICSVWSATMELFTMFPSIYTLNYILHRNHAVRAPEWCRFQYAPMLMRDRVHTVQHFSLYTPMFRLNLNHPAGY